MTRAVTANVESSLPRAAAARCLDAALDLQPDILGLQEWRLPRLGLLRRYGAVRLAGTPLVVRPGRADAGPMVWAASLHGDCVLGLRRERYVVRRHRTVRLSRPGPADRGTRRPPILPPRWATVVEADDRNTGHRVAVVVFHLVPGSQRKGGYRADRERTTRQHRHEVDVLGRALVGLLARCTTAWALGDTNFHGLRLPGLCSAWDGVPGGEGTLGSYRRIDDVFGTGPATRVETYVTESDHRMVLVERAG